jgi:hypothetical protein
MLPNFEPHHIDTALAQCRENNEAPAPAASPTPAQTSHATNRKSVTLTQMIENLLNM